jgi:hypothetical protein
MVDLDLDVEEEDQDRGSEPPAHWPSRDSVVQVENLTCHYAPQVRPFISTQIEGMLIFSSSQYYEESHLKLVQRRRLGSVDVQDLESLVSLPHYLLVIQANDQPSRYPSSASCTNQGVRSV